MKLIYTESRNNDENDEAEELEVEIFGRLDEDGNVDVLYADDGHAVNRFEAYMYTLRAGQKRPLPSVDIYPINMGYDDYCPEGIVLSLDDAKKLGLEIEDRPRRDTK